MRTLVRKLGLVTGLLVCVHQSTQAQFTVARIGGGASGSLTTNGVGSYTMIGGGHDIWSSADEFTFAYYSITGAFDIRVRVESLEPVARWTKAGIMARETLAVNSRMAFPRVTPEDVNTSNGGIGFNDTRFSYRTGTSLPSQGEHEDGTGTPNYPNAWLRLARSGNQLGAYRSTDGRTWTLQGVQDTVAWEGGAVAAILRVGLAVSRHSGPLLTARCEFRDWANVRSDVVRISRQPASATVRSGQSATFSVDVAGGYDVMSFQWRSNGLAIAYETNRTYTTPPLPLSASGAAYSVFVTNLLNGTRVTSANAIVSVINDTTRPTLLGAVADQTFRKVHLTFSEPVLSSSVTNQTNYSIAGLTIVGAELTSPSNITVTTSTQAAGTPYNIAVRAIRDASANQNQMIATNRNFTAWILHPGLVLAEIYDNIPGGVAVSSLTNHPRFPRAPNLVFLTNTFATPPNRADAYGARVSGFFVPTAVGATGHLFYARGDDGFQLYFGTSDDPVSRQLVINGLTCCQPYSSNRSSLLLLSPGQRYYIEGLMKEQAGGDYLQVAFKLPQNPGNPDTLPTIPSAYLTVAANPDTAAPLSFTQQPVSTSAIENGVVSFSAALFHLADRPPFLQWQKNGVDIPGAIAPSYTTPPLHLSDDGATYRLVASVPGRIVTSASAMLTVSPDDVPPQLVSVATLNGWSIGLCFDELLDVTTATDIANYSVLGAAIIGVTLRPDGKSVILQIGEPVSTPRVTVNNVRDLAGNVIASNSSVTGRWWASSADVGGSQPPGSTFSCKEGDADMLAGGADIWGTSDQFHYLYMLRTNDFDVQVKVERLDAADAWSKAGIVARASLNGTSASVAAYTSPRDFPGAGLYQAAIRRSTALPTEGFGSNPATELPNAWIRLRRCGQLFTASHSSNGVSWVEFAQTDTSANPFPSVLYVGLGATSHNTNQLTTAHFRNFGDAPLVITLQPSDQTVVPGGVADFIVQTCPPALSYQWRLNGVNIPGATNSTLILPNVQPADGGSYSAVVTRPGLLATSRTATLLVLAPVQDFTDGFAAGFPVDTSTDVRATNNTTATRQFGEPNHAGKVGGKSMWLRWHSPLTGVVTFDTRGSSFDTLLAAYTGNAVSNLTHIASDDDGGGFLTSKITFNANEGIIYHIVVDGFAGESGNIVLNWRGEFGPHVPVIVSGPSNLVVRAGSNVTYRVIATNFPSGFQWYFNGNPMPGATDDILQLPNVRATNVGSYWVRAFSVQTEEVADSKAVRLEIASSPAALSVDKVQDLFPLPVPPPGFAGFNPRPQVVVAAGTLDSQVLNNANSTLQPGEPNHCGVLGGASRWFALENASVTPLTFIVDTSGSSINTILAVYTGTDPLSLQLVTCTNGPGSNSRVTFAAAPMGRYSVVVDGVNGAQGVIQLNWKLGLLPVITQHPESRTVPAGQNYTNEVAATGLPLPQFQWISNSVNVFRGTNATLPVLNPSRSARYFATASNFMGVVTSAEARVAVAHPFSVDPQRVTVGGSSALRLGAIMSSSPNATNAFVIQATTDLYQWTSIFTNRVPVASTNFIDPDRALFPYRFYRVIPYPPWE